MNSKYALRSIGAALVIAAAMIQSAMAHVTVKPAQVNVATYQVFTVSVPVEKDIPTTGLRVVLPDTLESVTPTVKPGWTIAVQKESSDEDAKATEITWTGGMIPADRRDEFTFSAKAPADATTLTWKAYQTYQDGSVVSWDQEGSSHEESEDKGPASTTAVVDDLSAGRKSVDDAKVYSVIAVILSLISVAFTMNSGKDK